MKEFWCGLICGQDDKASMAKSLTWLTFILIVVSWFWFPDRAISELSIIFAALLGYTLSGKFVWAKYSGDDPEEDNKKAGGESRAIR